MAIEHYENFPVASWLLPARMRAPIEAIYAFARSADDIADEGDAADAERLAGLDRYLAALDRIERGERPAEAPFARLFDAVHDCALPVALLRDLIDAFKQDVTTKRYATFADLADYARRSANPVGRLVLHVATRVGDGAVISAGEKSSIDPHALAQSDAICTSLQLINFWQDVAIDWAKGRVYVPQEDLARFGVSEADIAAGRGGRAWGELMAFECDRARAMMRSGAPLAERLPGRLRLEIRATVEGGLAIADKIDAVSGDVFRNRPVLGPRDWMRILARALMGPRQR